MSYFNQAVIVGNVGKDPKISGTGDKLFASFQVAVTSYYKKDDQTQTKTVWINIVAFGRVAKRLKELKAVKGSKLMIIGEIENNNYDDAHGNKHYSLRILAKQISLIAITKNEDEAYDEE